MTELDLDIRPLLSQTAEAFNAALTCRLDAATVGAPPRLVEAMRYSLESGGKRVRPALVLWCCDLCGGRRSAACPAAMAVECVHTFSLIHDDLPALDNDALRRGRPACHKQFDEATAILAGDALLSLAFEIITSDEPNPAVAAAMVRELSTAAGCGGMIGGELADLLGQAAAPDEDLVARIHAAKTARLFEAACRLGAMAARAELPRIDALAEYGRQFGLAFQAADDLLDVTGTEASVGKAVGKDGSAGKQTYLRAVGLDGARRNCVEASERAIAALASFGERASNLAALARYVTERDR